MIFVTNGVVWVLRRITVEGVCIYICSLRGGCHCTVGVIQLGINLFIIHIIVDTWPRGHVGLWASDLVGIWLVGTWPCS